LKDESESAFIGISVEQVWYDTRIIKQETAFKILLPAILLDSCLIINQARLQT